MNRPLPRTRRGPPSRRRPLLLDVELLEGRQLLSTFAVLNTADSGVGSLRQAILDVNGASGTNAIAFNIPGGGVHTIVPLSALPAITQPVTIDGYTQPGSSPNTLAVGDNAVIAVELSGAGAGAVNGLTLTAGATTVRGLVLNRFNGAAFYVTGGGGDVIAGNLVGTDPTGTAGFAGTYQVGVQSYAPDLTIGGLSPADRNVLSGALSGIDLFDGTGDRLLNNYVGTDKTGTAALGNRSTGIYLRGAAGVIVGGTTAAVRNVVSGGLSDGIKAETAGNVIEGNDIGTNAAGTAALGNAGSGVVLDNGGNTVGGTASGAGNLISGNGQAGVLIHFSAPTAPGNVVEGNLIGTDKTGTSAIANLESGVDIGNGGGGGYNNTIGGTTTAARNIISGNGGNGVFTSGGGSGNVIEGNYMGVDITGLAALPNVGHGIDADGVSNLTIGGTMAGAGNVISRNKHDGILIFSHGVVVEGNLIGLGADGVTPLGNSGAGITTYYDTQIGGTSAPARNVIASNGASGINLYGGTGKAVVQGNYIGTDASGLLPRGNASFGVLANIAGNTIGGPDAGAGNVISANGAGNVPDGNNVLPGGIDMRGASGNLIQGNLIGLGSDGLTPLGNRGSGVTINAAAPNNIIRRNTIAYNAADADVRGAGVEVIDGDTVGNVIDSNSIFANSGLGIDLGNDGVTPNTPGGAQSGPNELQNYPVISSVTTTSTETVIVGTLNAVPAKSFTLQFFSNPATDPSGHSQGKTFLGEMTGLMTDTTGNVSFTVSFKVLVAAGQLVTATATDPSGNTSEFSQAAPLTPPANPLVVTTIADDGPGSLRAAITYADANPGLNAITFAIPGAGAHTIAPTSPLPTITTPLTIDGYSQPGAHANTLALGEDAVLLIELNGAITGDGGLAPSVGDGLVLSGGNSTIRGLAIDGFSAGAAVHVLTQSGNTIAGDFLGTDSTGTLAKPNRVGIQVETANNTIGGTTPAARDVVSSNTFVEVYLLGTGATGNHVVGDFVGTNAAATGSLSQPGGGDGVDIDLGATANTVGGATASARNVISGNGASGVRIAEVGTSANVVQGNFIGTDVSGTLPLGNTFHGVLIHRGAGTNIIGGAAPGAGNVISANLLEGVTFSDANTSGNTVQGNRIGTDPSGTLDLGNQGDGFSATFSAFNNTIGGSAPGAGNTIAHNVLDGVRIVGGTGNALTSNSIFSNHLLGIDLGGDGVTPNTPGGPHSGANDLQNFPVLTSAVGSAAGTVVNGTLDSAPRTLFTVQFFSIVAGDPSGHGQGRTYLGELKDVSTNTDGFANFTASLLTVIPVGQFVTATATDPGGNTSEFSQDRPVTATPSADLQLSISPPTANPGLTNQAFRYTFTVTNAGPQDATNVVIQETNASGVVIGLVTTNGQVTTVSPTQSNVAFASVAAGTSVTATFAATSAEPGSYTVSATVAADQADPKPQDNAASATEVVAAPTADLAVTGSSSPAVNIMGESVNFTFIASNNGPGLATGVTISDALPAGLRLVSAVANQGSVSQSGGVATFQLGALASHATASLSVVATILEAGSILNTANIRGDQADPNLTNNQVTITVNAAIATQEAPTNVFGNLVDSGNGLYHVLVTWGYPPAPFLGFATFNVYRSTGAGGTSRLLGSSGTGHYFNDAAVTAGATYTYQIASVLGGVESARTSVTITVSLNDRTVTAVRHAAVVHRTPMRFPGHPASQLQRHLAGAPHHATPLRLP